MKKMKLLLLSCCICIVSLGARVSNGEEIKIKEVDVNSGVESEKIISDGESIVSEISPIVVTPNIEKSASPRTIFGNDDRYRVNTTKYPYSAVVRLTVGQTMGTGFLISPDTVVTAAHCVYDDGKWDVKGMKVQPGYDYGYLPFGETTVKQAYVPQGWIKGGGAKGAQYNTKDDIAVIKLNSPIGNKTGTFGITTGTSNIVSVTGYPGEPDKDGAKVGGMYSSSGSLTSISSDFITYRIDMTKGHSGGPVHNSSNYAIGVNIAQNNQQNYGIRINNYFNFITDIVYNVTDRKKITKTMFVTRTNAYVYDSPHVSGVTKRIDYTDNFKDNKFNITEMATTATGVWYKGTYTKNNSQKTGWIKVDDLKEK